jgi:hypothetical protein
MKFSRLAVVVGSAALVLGLAAGQLVFNPQGAAAQESDQCALLVSQALEQAESACAGLASGEACYAHTGVTVSGGGNLTFATSGDVVALDSIQSLATTAANPDTAEWGVAMLTLPGALPEGGTQDVAAVLFGDAAVSRPASVAAGDRPTLTIWNSGGADVNVRDGAGITYNVVGALTPGQQAVADARNQESDWVRIHMEDGTIAWVFVRLINWDGDLNTLEVLLPDDITTGIASTGGEPFHALTLTTGPVSDICGSVPSGLLLQFAGEQAATLTVNQVNLTFSSAMVLLTADPLGVLDVMVMSGSGTVTARGIAADALAGNRVQVDLGGEDGLTPVAAPAAAGAYTFPEMVNVPSSLLGGEIACMVGVPSANAYVPLRVGPGEQRGEYVAMDPNTAYVVIGWANDPEGNPWWQLDTGDPKTWVAQSQVNAVGACDAVVQVEPPPLVFAPPPPPPADGDGAEADTGVDDFSPSANSVWQMVPGSDNMSGTCSGAPAINFCDHLAAIAPASGGISWKGMEASPYYLVRIQPNVYSYSGPNVLGTGTVSMTLRFTGENTLTMTQVLTLNSEPNCQHTYYYTGSRNW